MYKELDKEKEVNEEIFKNPISLLSKMWGFSEDEVEEELEKIMKFREKISEELVKKVFSENVLHGDIEINEPFKEFTIEMTEFLMKEVKPEVVVLFSALHIFMGVQKALANVLTQKLMEAQEKLNSTSEDIEEKIEKNNE